jgi:RNA polymerase sigma factor (sigma-70 family)
VNITDSFYKKYRRRVRRLLRRVPEQDADDVFQEAFLRFLMLETRVLVRNPPAYMYAITDRVALEFARKGRDRRIARDCAEVEQLPESLPDPGSNSLEEQVHAWQRAENALSGLSPTHKAVLLLMKFFGCTRKETAAGLGITVNTVKKYAHEASAQIKATLSGRDWSECGNTPPSPEEPDSD